MKTSLLRVVLGASIVSTAIHYSDNAISIEQYPQPSWISAPVVFIAWVVLTGFGIAGYVLYRRRESTAAYACLVVYSYTGLSTLGHLFYGSISGLSGWRQLFIWTDGLTGSAVLAFVLWSAVTSRREPVLAASPPRS